MIGKIPEAHGELDKYYSEEYAEQPPLPAGETLSISRRHSLESIAGKIYFSLAE